MLSALVISQSGAKNRSWQENQCLKSLSSTVRQGAFKPNVVFKQFQGNFK